MELNYCFSSQQELSIADPREINSSDKNLHNISSLRNSIVFIVQVYSLGSKTISLAWSWHNVKKTTAAN